MSDQAKIHNEIAGRIVSDIVRPVLTSSGSPESVMVLTESVLVGVALSCIRLGGDEKVLDLMFANAKQRLAGIRLKDIRSGGSA